MTIKDFLESYSFWDGSFDENIKLIIADSSERIEYETFLSKWRELPYYIVVSKIDFWRINVEHCNNTVVAIYIQRR